MHAVLGDGRVVPGGPTPPVTPALPVGGLQLQSFRERVFGTHAGMRAVVVESSALCGEPEGERSRLVLVAGYGVGLAAPEVSGGLDPRLPSVDPEQAPGRPGHLLA